MASQATATSPNGVNGDTLVVVKILYGGQNRRFKLALRDLGAQVLPQKLRFLLSIPEDSELLLERYSDSAGSYVVLDSNNPSIYKQLYRAAKAKLKLRLKATLQPSKSQTTPVDLLDDKMAEANKIKSVELKPEPRSTYLETVLSQPVSPTKQVPAFKSFQDASRPLQNSGVVRMPGAFNNPDVSAEPTPRATPRSSNFSQPTIPCFRDFSGTFSIDCNACGQAVPNEHYHCSICENGDYDLCLKCVDDGATCTGEDHWLIKRFIRNGIIIPSVTETCAPRKVKQEEEQVQEEERAQVEIPAAVDFEERTCNSCINQLPASAFVTCKDCPDFDLCQSCFIANDHGHSLVHEFEPVSPILHHNVSSLIKSLCQQSRGLVHQATCDACDKQIVGVRHKCLSCPDYDVCSECHKSVSSKHSGHRFAPLYEPLPYVATIREHHRGIFCDGPLCTGQNRGYIRGDRYKCAVCHDTDFCADCEAMPGNYHNKTHPLIKIKVPLRHVTIQTTEENNNGQEIGKMGDRRLAKHASTETVRTTSTNAATQVQTVAEVRPAESTSSASSSATATVKIETSVQGNNADLQAWYESDSTPDGSNFLPNRLVSQSWTLRNPGPETWPKGCAVYFIGGDDMRNLDLKNPSNVSSMVLANRSNVLDEPLAPGKTAVFTVLLKSPTRLGRHISYFRIKTPEGLPFGHKLWVDINVKEALPEAQNKVPLPIRRIVTINSKQATVEDEEVESTEKKEETDQEGSTMIFPKLEKESPISSVHDVSETTAAEPTPSHDEQSLLDDVESLELESESDDGFLTDEEYDVLDASDEDFLDAQMGSSK